MQAESEAKYQAFNELNELSPSDANYNAFTHGWHSHQEYIKPLLGFCLQALRDAPEEIFGMADNGYGIVWAVRDEVIADFKKAFPGVAVPEVAVGHTDLF